MNIKNRYQTVFRYPGGKKKLASKITLELWSDLERSSGFIETFVGGASVAICVAENFKDKKIVINDADFGVSIFWKLVVSDDWMLLADMIKKCKPTLELFYRIKSDVPSTDISVAFRTLFLNRTTFSGVFSGGPIGGKGQASKYPVDCRYNGPELSRRIELLHLLLRGRTTVLGVDGIDLLHKTDPEFSAYCDPPYDQDEKTSIYGHLFHEYQHKALSEVLRTRKLWLTSYNDNKLIRSLYSWASITRIPHKYSICGKKVAWAGSGELLIRPK